jgi:N-acetylneuraminic acid mutarotase
MKPFKLLIIIAAVFGCNLFFCYSGSGTETIGYTTVGTVIDESGKSVPNARVDLLSVEKENSVSTPIKSVLTNVQGVYVFDSLPSGQYSLLITSPDKKVAYRPSFIADSSIPKNDIGKDTVYKPGTIKGCIIYSTHIQKEVKAYIPGTSFQATTDSDVGGKYEITGVPKGIYTLKITSADYQTIRRTNVTVFSDSITNIGNCDTLVYDTTGAPPPPKGLKLVSYDEFRGAAKISWDKLHIADLAGYIILRNEVPVDTVKDTFFVDILTFNSSLTINDSIHSKYKVVSIDNKSNSKMQSDDILRLSAISTAFFKPQIDSLVCLNKNGSDSVTNADTAIITAYFSYNKRAPRKCIWYKDSLQGSVVVHSLQNVKNGMFSDKVDFNWTQPGLKFIYIKIVDSLGDTSTFKQSVTIFDIRDIRKPNTWNSFADSLPISLSLASCFLYNNTIYTCGGMRYDPNNKQNTIQAKEIYKYDLVKKVWELDPNTLKEPLYKFSSAVFNNTLYIFGGLSSKTGYSRKYYKLNLNGGSWVEMDLPSSIGFGMSATVYGSFIYLIGGYNSFDENGTDSIFKFDPQTEMFTSVCKLGTSRAFHQTVLAKDKMYIIGGEKTDGSNDVLGSVEIFEPQNGSIKRGPSLNHEREFFAAAFLNNKIYVFNGLNSSTGSIVNKGEYLDLSSNISWIDQNVASSSVPIQGCGVVTLNKSLYIIGGATDPGMKKLIKSINVYYP